MLMVSGFARRFFALVVLLRTYNPSLTRRPLSCLSDQADGLIQYALNVQRGPTDIRLEQKSVKNVG